MLDWPKEIAVTFDPALFDRYPNSLRFLSYGSPLLTEILGSVAESDEMPPYLARFAQDNGWPLCGWYDLRPLEPCPIESLADLRLALDSQFGDAPDGRRDRAQALFDRDVETLVRTRRMRQEQLRQQRRGVLQAKAASLLQRGAMTLIALGQQRSLYDTQVYPMEFNREAVIRLGQHGPIWQWLIVMATNKNADPLPELNATDPYFEKIKDESEPQLKKRLTQLAEEGLPLVVAWRLSENPIVTR